MREDARIGAGAFRPDDVHAKARRGFAVRLPARRNDPQSASLL
jgi:hypothetical protein